MSENYTVHYNINVNSQKAIDALNAFQQATANLTAVQRKLTSFQKKIDQVTAKFSQMSKKAPVLDFGTSKATQKLNSIISKLERINKLAKQNRMITINTAFNKSAVSGPGGFVASNTAITGGRKSVVPNAAKPKGWNAVASSWVGPMKMPNAIGYKTFGATPLPNNGGMAIDMLKGMGIAYGLSGLGQAVGNIVSQASNYDNIMKTVENILKSHDYYDGFSDRFQKMSRTVRNVGMETKFKVTEVADAAKFLAMAGLDVDAIQKSIRPIADIALVGDTELGETADLVTNIMTAYNISPNRMRNAADVMTNTFTMSNTTLTEIAESYKYAASLLSAGGVAFEESTAAIGVLGDAGIKGSQAGTTLRTIMANIVNPTKKQAAAWKEIGVNTKNKDGDTKNLLEIFKELDKKNLGVGDYYRLFHKTAASGAVALSDHVDKWNQIYLENFLSDGLSSNLADEKKNTIQGLWAQLTSVFTDQGVTAFGGIQGQLRGWMHQAIDWLKSDRATEVFRNVSNTLMEFAKTIIDSTKWFAKLYEMFAPMIKMWVKFQLIIWPVVKAIQAFKSVVLGVHWLGSFANGLRSVAVNMEQVAIATNRANLANGQSGAAAATGMAGGATNSAMVAGGATSRLPHLWHDPRAIWRYSKMRTKQWGKNVWGGRKGLMASALMGAGGMARMGAGALGAYAGMSQITKEDSNFWDNFSGGLFAAAGLSAMVGGPIGWVGGAALAVAGLAASIGSFATNLGKLQDYVNDFSNTHKMLDGALLNSDSKTERLLEFVWRKNFDINELIQRRIELSKTLYGIESAEAATTKDVGTEVYKNMYERFYAADSMWGSRGAAGKAVELLNKYSREFGIHVDTKHTNWVLTMPNGKSFVYQNPNGTTDTNDAVMYDSAAALELLHGSYRQKIIDENQKRLSQLLYGKSTGSDVQEWINTFNNKHNPAKMKGLIRPDQWNVDTETAKYWNGDDIAKSYLGASLLWESLHQARAGQRAILEFKQKMSLGNYNESDVVKALRWGDYNIFGPLLADYNPNDVVGWFSRQGFQNGTWVGMNGETPENMAAMATGNMKKLLEAIKLLGLESDPATAALRSYSNTLLTLAESFMGAGKAVNGIKEGETKIINGQKWRWNSMTRVWELVDDNGQLAQVSQGVVDFATSISTLSQSLNNAKGSWPMVFTYGVGQPSGSGADSIMGTLPWSNPSQPHGTNYGQAVWNPLTSLGSRLNFGWSNPLTKNLGSPVLKSNTNKTNLTMTPQQMGNAINALTNPSNRSNPSFGGGGGGKNTAGGGGPKASDYKNQYNSGNAAPKQVIVRIGNLMNVDKIDLSNPNNAAVIASLKSELAQALVDVVHDFDETWHG